jgi:hypothetical protein
VTVQDILLLLGAGFLVANVRAALDFLRFLRRRSSALLVWRPPKPRYYAIIVAVGVMMGFLIAYNFNMWRLGRARNVVFARQLFGEGMMFFYYTVGVAMTQAIRRGFYADGIWSDRGFMPYSKIGAVGWREGKDITLLMTASMGAFARSLVVPRNLYGEARRLLRDRIEAHDITFVRPGLDLGLGNERDKV